MAIVDGKIQLEFGLQPSDFKAMQNEHTLRGIKIKYLRPILIGIIVVYLVLKWDGTVPSLISMLLAVGLILGIFWLIMRSLRKSQQKTNPIFREIQYVTIDEKSYSAKAESHESTMYWPHFHKVVEVRDYFFAYQSTATAFIIPKRAMSEEEIAMFLEIVKGVEGLEVKSLK